MLELNDLYIGYHNASVAGPVEEKLNKGELVCLLGPNGTGKSTLLKTIAGLIDPIEGKIIYDGTNFSQIKPRLKARILSVVLTESLVIGNFTASEIVELGRYPYTGWWGGKKETDVQIAKNSLKQTRITHLANKPIAEMSDGEKQKVMIARALAQDTDYILLDEPTSHLDLPSKIEIMTLLKELAHNWNKSVLVSTHDINLAIQAADKFWLINSKGEFFSGVNEDLIINGHLNQCFDLEEKKFNFLSGKISLPVQVEEDIILKGSGPIYSWTKHALERIGYKVSKKSDIVVDVDDAGQWIVSYEKREEQLHSISDLLDHLHQVTKK